MNKILIINILILMVLPNQLWATIQKAPTNAVTAQNVKQNLSLKQRVFSYLIQRKMRRLQAKQTTQNNILLRECVTITLKNGRTIWATILTMDDNKIVYKFCNSENTAEGTVLLEQVASVTDAQNRTIFNNRPKILKVGEPTKGDRYATLSISALGIALGSALLATIIFVSVGAGSFEGIFLGLGLFILGFGLLILSFISIIVSFIAGIMSLVQMATTPPQKEYSRLFAIVSTVVLGLFVLLMLIGLGAGL
jgi:hypothetical protein